MRTTAIINLKGGVGKTTTAINLSYQLYRMGRSVLLIDLDSQGNTSKFYFPTKDWRDGMSTSADVLLGRAEIQDCVHRARIPAGKEEYRFIDIDVLPSDMSMGDAEINLATIKGTQYNRLKEALAEIDDAMAYDYCIIDCAPHMGIVEVNAIVAADDVIIPVQADMFTEEGLTEAKANYNHGLTYKALLTAYRNNTFSQLAAQIFNTKLKGRVYETKIRWSQMVSESTYKSQPISDYSPRCAAAISYREFTKEYMKGDR
jgi:chromosome partitioning protein